MSIEQIKNAANIKKITVTVDSDFKTSGTRNNFTYNLVTPITDIRLVEITNVELNNDTYNINDYRNSFNWRDHSGVTRNITLTKKSSSIDILTEDIENAMNGAKSSTGSNYMVRYSDDKVTFSTYEGVTFNLNFSVTQNSIGPLLGFTNGVDKINLSSYTSDFPFDINYTTNLFIGSTNLAQGAFDSSEISNGVSNILDKLEINAEYGEIIFSDKKKSIRNKINSLSTIDIVLKDDTGQLYLTEKGNFKITFDIYSRVFNNNFSI